MINEVALSSVKFGKIGAPVKRYVLDLNDIQQFSSVVVKNNTILEMETYGQDDQQLSGTDVQLLSTAFLMAQCIKENRGSFDANTVFEMPMSTFCELWRIKLTKELKKDGNIYRELINSVSRLNQRVFVYPDVDNSKMVESGYFSHIKYNNTVIEFAFPLPIIEYIKKENDFTWYFLENILKLQDATNTFRMAQYATLLYEHIQKDKIKSKYKQGHIHTVEIESERLKTLLGVEPGKWKRHIDFRTKVLDRVVEFIHDRVGMYIEITNVKKGARNIYGYRFVTTLSKNDLDFSAAMRKAKDKPIMTLAQRERFSGLLIEHTTFDMIYRLPGEKNPEFCQRIEELLAKNEKLIEFEPYLRAVGYKSKKFDTYISKLDDAVKAKIEANKANSIQGSLDLGSNSNSTVGDGTEDGLPF